VVRARDKALEREQLQRRLDARELMRLPAFRRLARWLTKPTEKLPFGVTDRDTAFKAGQWFSANELRELLRAAHFDAFQRMERESRTDTVPRRSDSADS
jgi:hypothetical protein